MSGLEARFGVTRGSFSLDVDLQIAPGRTLAVLGPNGAGKSTTVEAIAGTVAVDDGAIVLGGRVLDAGPGNASVFVPPEGRRIGIVHQDYLLFPHLSVLDNVAFAAMAVGRRRAEARRSVERWMDALELGALAGRRPSELSGGQAQRVAMARAFASEPDLLLLDEPLAALDIDRRGRIRQLLADQLDGFDGPRLLITHDPADAALLADRVAVMENGTITQEGAIDDIRRRPATPYAAALAGTNLISATNRRGDLALDHSPLVLRSSDTHTEGAVLVTIHPTAIALHREEPHGSPRNVWPTTVATIEPLGDITRVTLGEPLDLGVDVTPGAVAALDLERGTSVWAAVKATEIELAPAD